MHSWCQDPRKCCLLAQVRAVGCLCPRQHSSPNISSDKVLLLHSLAIRLEGRSLTWCILL